VIFGSCVEVETDYLHNAYHLESTIGQPSPNHKCKFASQTQNYWSRDQQGYTEWQGKLAQAVEACRDRGS